MRNNGTAQGYEQLFRDIGELRGKITKLRSARAEGQSAAETLALVKALGYLTMHTRQLDMVR